MGSPIRILHLDDNSSDATLVALALEVEQKKLHTQVHYVQTKEEYLAALDQKDFDLILSDYRMPGFDGDQALAVAREKCPEIPFIMVTGELGEELVIQTLHRGATDYVLKDRMFRLVPAIKRALAEADNYRKRKEAEREIQKRQGELWAIIQAMHGGVMVFDAEGGVVLVNDALVSTLGYKDSSELRRTLSHLAGILELWESQGRLIPLDEWPVSRIMRGEIVTNMELKARRIDTGREWFFSFSGQPVRDETGKQILSVLVVRDITERRIAEEAQRQSEERFRALVQASANVVYRMSPDWKEMRQLVGQNFIADTKDPSRTWLEKYIHPDDQPRVLAAIEKAIRSKSVFELEHRVLRVDGSLGWTFSRAIPMLAANGEITEWFGMASDITEQKTSEQSLKAERARLTAILESIPEEVWYADNDRRVMQVNRKVVEDFGEQLEVGGEIEKIAAQFEVYRANGTPRPPDEAPPLRALHGEFIREEEEIVRAPATGELRYRLVTASPVRDSQGDVTGSVSIVRDITERKRAEEALRESEARFRVMADNIPQLAWMTDETGWIFWYNQRWYDYTGTTLKEMEGWGWQKVHHPEHVERVTERFRRALVEGQSWEDTFPLRSRRGEYRWFLSRAYPIKDIQGKVIRWFGTNTDITDQLRIEDALRSNEATMEAFFDASPGILNVFNEELRYIQTDRLTPTYFGLDRQSLIGRSVAELNPMFAEEFLEPMLKRILETAEAVMNIEVPGPIPSRGGEIGCWQVSYFPVHLPGGKKGMGVMGIDITERKKAEDAAREAALFPEENPSPALRISHEGTLLYANPASRDILQDWGFRVKEKVPYTLYEPVNEALEKKRGRTFDLSVKDATYSFLVVPIVERQYANLYGRDVTDQRHAEERLKRLNEELQKRNLELDGERLKWQKLIEGIADEVWACDLEGRVSLLSLKSPTSGGPAQVSDEVLRTLLSEFEVLRPDGSLRPDEESPLQLSLKGQIVRGEESVRLRSTGETRIRQHSCVPVRDTDGNIVGAVAIVRDITEGRQAEEKVRRLNEELEERVQQRTVALERANKELEAFSYTVSHDLKAPLRAITGFTGLLVNSSKEGVSAMAPDKQRQYMELILSSAEQMSKLIESLLTFARTQRQVPQVVRVNMLQLAEQVVQEQLQALGEAAARVRVHMLEMPREAHGDPVLLKQVYANLISNAFKFTRKQEEPEIEIGGYERDGQLVYFVRDNGAGFPSEKVHDLFRVFRRLHGQAEFEGTGIGLANVRKIVERHGGEVCAEGEDGKGATFYFALPANP